MSFWDSSAIVPLCLYEERSPIVGKLWKQFSERIVCWETPVEIASAIAKAERENKIDGIRKHDAGRLLTAFEDAWVVVRPEDRIIQLARTFPSVHGLRALDSLQLAAALVWCREFPKNKDFVSADARLSKAAESEGFTVHFLN